MNHESRVPEPTAMPQSSNTDSVETSGSGSNLQVSVGDMHEYPHGGGGMMAMPMPSASGGAAFVPQPYSDIAGQPDAVDMAAGLS